MPKFGWCSERHGGLYAFLRCHLLAYLTVISITIGIGTGFALRTRTEPWTAREIMYISFPGTLYLRILTCLILPLLTMSIISSVGSLDPNLSGWIVIRATVYYTVTLTFALFVGIFLVTTIHPGQPMEVPPNPQLQGDEIPGTPIDTILDLIRNLFTDNLVTSCFEQYETVLIPPSAVNNNVSGTLNDTVNGTISVYDYKISSNYQYRDNVIGLVFFCVVVGVSIRRLKKKGRPVLKFCMSLYDMMMEMVKVVVWFSPICVSFLICGEVLQIVHFNETVERIWLYVVTVLLGLFIHGFLFIPLVYFAVTRANPYRFLWNQVEALTAAFATSSSTVTMPVSIRCLEDRNSIHPKVARFVIPIGILNMEGCALYETVSVIFIAQLNGIEMNAAEILVLSLTSVAATMGAAGVPEAGILGMILILNSVGLPTKDISLIAVVDFMLNRLRVMINVLSDNAGAGIVNYLSKPDLLKYDILSSVDSTRSSSSLSRNNTYRNQKKKRVSVDSGVDVNIV